MYSNACFVQNISHTEYKSSLRIFTQMFVSHKLFHTPNIKYCVQYCYCFWLLTSLWAPLGPFWRRSRGRHLSGAGEAQPPFLCRTFSIQRSFLDRRKIPTQAAPDTRTLAHRQNPKPSRTRHSDVLNSRKTLGEEEEEKLLRTRKKRR